MVLRERRVVRLTRGKCTEKTTLGVAAVAAARSMSFADSVCAGGDESSEKMVTVRRGCWQGASAGVFRVPRAV